MDTRLPAINTRRLGPGAHAIEAAAAMLTAGGLVGFPTETVYGLGADAADAAAVARLFAAKGRPHFNPLIAHVATIEAARNEGVFDPVAERLAAAFWPGPLTLVLPLAATARTCELARAGLDSVALRIPADPIAQALLARFGGPLVAPSANRSGHVSATTADHVLDDLAGVIDAVIDAGPVPLGLESTIVACLGAQSLLLRPGALPRATIAALLGHPLDEAAHAAREDDLSPLAPGRLASHYAPRARLRLDATSVAPEEAVLGFGLPWPQGWERASARCNLSPNHDLTEAAARLYGSLRTLDAQGAPCIAVAPIPPEGLGEAINDRLRRAAAPR